MILSEVVYACDEKYAVPLTVSLRSLQSCSTGLHVTVLGLGITGGTRRTILDSLERPTEISFFDIDERHLPARSSQGVTTRISRVALARLQIPRDLVSRHRFVYLDSDTVIRHDIGELLATDLGGHVLGAVYDRYYSAFERSTSRLSAQGTRRFNSGVLLVDSERWFTEGIGAQALRIVTDSQVMDQGALNTVCAGRWQELEPAWNVTTQQLRLERRHRANPTAAQAPVHIRHLTAIKPWMTDETCSEQSDVWMLGDYYRHYGATRWPGTDEPHRPRPESRAHISDEERRQL